MPLDDGYIYPGWRPFVIHTPEGIEDDPLSFFKYRVLFKVTYLRIFTGNGPY